MGDHYTGKFRNAAHDICNLKFNIPNKVLVVFHNGSNCDYHFIIKEWITKRVRGTNGISWGKRRKVIIKKDVYPYECMDEREKFNETTLPEKEEFYSNLNMEDITDAADYMHLKRICKDFEIRKGSWVSWFLSWKWYITFGWCF